MKEDPTGLILPPEQVAQAQAAAAQGAGQSGPDPLIGQARMLSAQAQAQKAQRDSEIAAAKLNIDQQKLADERSIAQTNLAKEMIIHRSDAWHEQRAQELDAHRIAAEHVRATNDQHQQAVQAGLEHQRTLAELHGDTIQNAHDRAMEQKQHELEVHKVLHPPPPSKGQK